MSSNWGSNVKLSIFGESHGKSIGAILDGLPPGYSIDLTALQGFMQRRAPGQTKFSTPRKEADLVEVESGLYQGKTTGTPLCGIIKNTNIRSQDYQALPFRPSHADHTGSVRYQGANDPRGGGHFSGRLTAPLTLAGGIAKQILEKHSIVIGAHIYSIGKIKAEAGADKNLTAEQLLPVAVKEFPVISDELGNKMIDYIEEIRLKQDSVGGVISCTAFGVPAGIGSPMFDGLENKLASLLFGIPAVRGIEFGTGFAAAELLGSQHNDPYYQKDGKILTKTNHHGGILGGISSGMPLQLQVAIKPTPSIGQEQETVAPATGNNTTISIKGRHDPCIVPRAVPVVEACVALALLDAMLEGGNPNALGGCPKGN